MRLGAYFESRPDAFALLLLCKKMGKTSISSNNPNLSIEVKSPSSGPPTLLEITLPERIGHRYDTPQTSSNLVANALWRMVLWTHGSGDDTCLIVLGKEVCDQLDGNLIDLEEGTLIHPTEATLLRNPDRTWPEWSELSNAFKFGGGLQYATVPIASHEQTVIVIDTFRQSGFEVNCEDRDNESQIVGHELSRMNVDADSYAVNIVRGDLHLNGQYGTDRMIFSYSPDELVGYSDVLLILTTFKKVAEILRTTITITGGQKGSGSEYTILKVSSSGHLELFPESFPVPLD